MNKVTLSPGVYGDKSYAAALDEKRLNWIEERQADVSYDCKLRKWEVNSERGIFASNDIRGAIDAAMMT